MKIPFERATALYLYRCLGSEHRLSRRTAISNIERMEEEIWTFLGQQISTDIEQYRRSTRQRNLLTFVTISSVLWSLYAQWFALVPSHPDMIWLFLAMDGLALASTVALTATCATRHITRRRIRNGLFLAQQSFPLDRIGSLVDALNFGDDEISSLAQSLLIRLLPKVDGGALTRAQLGTLSYVLYGTNAHLIIAVLRAFERIGSPSALSVVQKLRHCPVWLADAPKIEQAATSCFMALQARSLSQAASRTLLRPTSKFAGRYQPDEQLLMPAHATQDYLHKDLLRSASANFRFEQKYEPKIKYELKTTQEVEQEQNVMVRG